MSVCCAVSPFKIELSALTTCAFWFDGVTVSTSTFESSRRVWRYSRMFSFIKSTLSSDVSWSSGCSANSRSSSAFSGSRLPSRAAAGGFGARPTRGIPDSASAGVLVRQERAAQGRGSGGIMRRRGRQGRCRG
jgi:hypothetical protein